MLTTLGVVFYHLILLVGCFLLLVGSLYSVNATAALHVLPEKNTEMKVGAVFGGAGTAGIGLFLVIEAVLGLVKWA